MRPFRRESLTPGDTQVCDCLPRRQKWQLRIDWVGCIRSHAGLRGNTMSNGSLGVIKQRLELWVKTTGRFPEFWEVGISVFMEIYDWHIRERQPIQITRVAEQRMAIQWMFTQYVLRWENDQNYIAPQPYDR